MTWVSWRLRAGIWIGIGINAGTITVGGGLASELSLGTVLLLIPLGALVLTLLAVSEGILSRRRRKPFAAHASSTYGPKAGLLTVVMTMGVIGWASFHVGIAGFSLADIFQMPVWVGALVIAALSFLLHELGVDRWNTLIWITALSALGLALFALVAVSAKPTFEVVESELNPGNFLWVVGGVVAYAILFALRSGDFTWDLRTDVDVVKVGASMMILMVIAMSIGAMLFQATGDWNIPEILAGVRLAQLFLIISVASPILGGLHSGGLALVSLTPLSRRASVGIICAIAFVLGAVRFDRQLLPFLTMMGAVLPSALIVMLASAALTRKPSPNTALTAWFMGAAAGLLVYFTGDTHYVAIGAAVSIVVLLIALLIPGAMRSASTDL
jgi:hypothetical protein